MKILVLNPGHRSIGTQPPDCDKHVRQKKSPGVWSVSTVITELYLNDLDFPLLTGQIHQIGNLLSRFSSEDWSAGSHAAPQWNVYCNNEPPAKPGDFLMRAKPYVTSPRVSSRKYGPPAARVLLLATRERV